MSEYIYAVELGYQYEGATVEGLFTSQEEAATLAKRIASQTSRNASLYVMRYTINTYPMESAEIVSFQGEGSLRLPS